MNDLPGDGAEPTPSEVVEKETVASNSPIPIEPTVVDSFGDVPSASSQSAAQRLDVVPPPSTAERLPSRAADRPKRCPRHSLELTPLTTWPSFASTTCQV